MADRKRVYLHIGAPKTGTTYLQQVLEQNRQALKDAGVLYPKIGREAHHTSAWALRGIPPQRRHGPDITADWDRLVERSHHWAGDAVIISSEHFVFCSSEEADRAVSAFDDCDVHLVYTARDLVRLVPAVWQERIKNQQTYPYDDFVRQVAKRTAAGFVAGFWLAQDAPAALSRWAKVPPHQVHIVTAPPAGAPASTLWDRFADAVGLNIPVATEVPVVNPSMDIVSAELLRRLNEVLGDELTWPAYSRLVRRPLDLALPAAIADARRAEVPARSVKLLRAKAAEMVEQLAAAGYVVHGDLDDLTPADSGSRLRRDTGPDDLDHAELLDAALRVLAEVLKQRGDDGVSAPESPAEP